MVQDLDARVCFVGGGNMAEAIIRGILNAALSVSSDISVSDVRRERLGHLTRSCGVTPAESNASCVASGDIIIIAVKPQNMAEVLRDLSSVDLSNKSIISIVAGTTTGQIEGAFRGEIPVIRVMPNTPALIGEGVSVWARGRHVKEKDIERARTILSAIGTEIEVGEELMDAATALSGSGPAYVFYLLEAMIAAGEKLGFSAEQAARIAIRTVVGAGRLAEALGQSPSELRKRVTSPGGTTAAAIKVLDDKGAKKIVIAAISAACERARELSKGG
ncbi:MAG: pyrroline-5-carboxylate reductase [Candidatus Aureabacteria bacterium]|nr:pyrroline-5-carboxylate reductase [Candidatus Auribacterota bacterium]